MTRNAWSKWTNRASRVEVVAAVGAPKFCVSGGTVPGGRMRVSLHRKAIRGVEDSRGIQLDNKLAHPTA